MAKQTWLVLSWGWNRLFFLPNTFRHRTPIIKNIVGLKADVLNHGGKIKLEKSSLLLSQKRYYWQKISWYFSCRQYLPSIKGKIDPLIYILYLPAHIKALSEQSWLSRNLQSLTYLCLKYIHLSDWKIFAWRRNTSMTFLGSGGCP